MVAYLRCSSAEQAASGLGLEAQEARIKAYALLHGLEIVAWERDEGCSGKTLDRPGMARVLAMLDRGAVAGVIVSKLDRLTRSVRDLDALVDRFTRGPRLVLVEGQADTATASGRMTLNIHASVNQGEREVIAERTSAALQAKKARGERAGQVPYGFAVDATDPSGQRLVEHPAEQAALAEMRRLHAAGLPTTRIAVELTARGFACRGAKFHQPFVWRMLAAK